MSKAKTKYIPLPPSPLLAHNNLAFAPTTTRKMTPPLPIPPPPSPFQSSQPPQRNRPHSSSLPRGTPPAGSSQSWTSPAALQSAKFNRLQNNANHLGFAQSPFFPRTPQEYARHQAEYAQDRMEGEKKRLKDRIEEREARLKGEAEGREDREGVEKGLRGLKVEDGDIEMDGKGKGMEGEVEGEGEGEVKGMDEENESDEKNGSEKFDNASNASGSVGKSKRKNHRGKRKSKGKNKIEIKEVADADARDRVADTKENIKPGTTSASTTKSAPKPTASKKSTAELAASLLSTMANDPLLKGVLAGTAKPPNSSLWKAFTQSPLYNPAGSATTMNLFASLQKPGRTTVLGAPTNIWAGDEHLKPEGRLDPKTGAQRSAWPELGELKAEGQYRKDAGKDRRLPLPRMDMMTKEAVIREAGGQEVTDRLNKNGVDAVCRDLMQKTGDEIAWMDREPVVFGGFDRLESVEKERREDVKRREMGEPVHSPTHVRTGSRGQGANLGLRGAYGQSGPGRRYTGAPLPAPFEPKPKEKSVHPEAISYGADGPGDGKVPPPGRWVFDEEFLKGKGDWEDLLMNHL